jgi:thymidylate synthase (FAD)
MNIVEPKIIVENYDGLKIMKNIERAMRTCYKSGALTTDDSYKRLLGMAIDSGHGSVMEHEKITVRIYCSLNFYKDITRHRAGTAFSIESTRWLNYSKKKFNGISFMNPVYITNEDNYGLWEQAMKDIEKIYLEMASNGAKPDELRTILPHSTAAEVTMTCNIREWRHILSLRTTNRVHPEIRQILIPLLLEFKKTMPELFNDIEYDTDFPTEWYAQLEVESDGEEN